MHAWSRGTIHNRDRRKKSTFRGMNETFLLLLGPAEFDVNLGVISGDHRGHTVLIDGSDESDRGDGDDDDSEDRIPFIFGEDE